MGNPAAFGDVARRKNAGGQGDQATSIPGQKPRCEGMALEPKQVIEAAHFSPDTLEFIRLLQKYGVRYVIIGGEAVIFHGYARFTGDVDFFYSSDAENADRLF